MSQDARILKPTPRASSGMSEETFLSYDDRSGETKNGLGGTVTMDGNRWKVSGASHTARTNGMSNGWIVRFPLPAGLMDGSNKRVRFKVKHHAAPTAGGRWRAQLGFLQNGLMGVGGGCEYRSGEYRANSSLLGSTSTGGNVGNNEATGTIDLPGDWNGSNTVGGTVCTTINSSTKGAGVGAQNLLSASYNKASTDLVVVMGLGENETTTDDLDFEVSYQILDAM